MDWVVDCSVTLALGLPDEHSAEAESFLKTRGAAAGYGWQWDVASTVTSST